MSRSAIRLMSALAAVALLFQVVIVHVLGLPSAATEASNGFEIEDPDEIHTESLPAPLPTPGDWKDWETWEASPDMVQSFPYFKMGYDLDGLAVYVIDYGKWDYRKLGLEPQEKMDEFWKYFEQLLRRQRKDAEMNNRQGMVEIIDWDGFELNHDASPKVNFAAETFINAVRPFLSYYLDKFEMHGGRMERWKPQILKKIGADQVAPKYGGSNPDWKPVPLDRGVM